MDDIGRDFPDLQNDLRLYEGRRRRIPERTVRLISWITEPLRKTPEEMGRFEALVFIENQLGNLDRGIETTDNLTRGTLEQARANLLAPSGPEVVEAVRRHFGVMHAIGRKLVDLGLLLHAPPSPRYAAQEVLDFVAWSNHPLVTGSGPLRKPQCGFLEKLAGARGQRARARWLIAQAHRLIAQPQMIGRALNAINTARFLRDKAAQFDIGTLTPAEWVSVERGHPITRAGKEYRPWHPFPGRRFFPVLALPKDHSERAVSQGLTLQQVVQGTRIFDDLSPEGTLIKFEKCEQSWVIPSVVADRLDSLDIAPIECRESRRQPDRERTPRFTNRNVLIATLGLTALAGAIAGGYWLYDRIRYGPCVEAYLDQAARWSNTSKALLRLYGVEAQIREACRNQ